MSASFLYPVVLRRLFLDHADDHREELTTRESETACLTEIVRLTHRGPSLNDASTSRSPGLEHDADGNPKASLVDVQLLQERERVVERFEQILVVLDHLAAHVDAKPLLVAVQLIAIEHVQER